MDPQLEGKGLKVGGGQERPFPGVGVLGYSTSSCGCGLACGEMDTTPPPTPHSEFLTPILMTLLSQIELQEVFS